MTKRHVPKQRLLTVALLLALSQYAAAQDAPATPAPATPPADAAKDDAADANKPQESKKLETVVVKGILGSLTSSMNLKRDATGIVDGIVAEDIGKFPDTNLAESLQRISGVSIDRVNGEGSKVTVRGVGPDFNLVLLNGRQMPASTIADTGASNSRAFDFANLASEAISQVEVYKSARASTPAGGIGATINIRTTRPLEDPGFHASVGIKGVHDTSLDNTPDSMAGSDWTPEISGIYSNTSDDGRFGVALSASFQERDFGFNQVSVGNGWRTFHGDENNWGTIPQPGQPGSQNIVNRPDPSDVYSVPQNLNYALAGVERERTNGQLTLQFAPSDNTVATLDYTYSENKIHTLRNDMSVWFNFGPSSSSWTDGPVAAPIVYSETIIPAESDLAMGVADFATKNQNKSLGFNFAWNADAPFGLEFDYHDSSATSGADSPFGSNNVIGTAGFYRGTTTADFSHDFPLLQVVLGSGIPGQAGPALTAPSPALQKATGSSFRNSYMKSEIEQFQGKGHWEFAESSRLDFGVAFTTADNRSAFSNVQRDSWGGTGQVSEYPDSLWHPADMTDYFNNIDGSDLPYFSQFFLFDFAAVRDAAAGTLIDPLHPELGKVGYGPYTPDPVFSTDRNVEEKSKSAFLQYSTTFDTSMPLHMAAGVRYESTDVTATALVPTANTITWVANNELSIQFGAPGFTTLKGSYDYFLPNIDFTLDVRDDMKLRASYGHSIGRPLWDQIQGGQTLDGLVRVNGGTGSQGNPALKPLLSKNFDLSFEWYYGEASYLSAGYFHKDIDNYVGISQITDTPFDLHTPIGGAYWNAALNTGHCASSDITCIRNYIFNNFNGQPGVIADPGTTNGNRTGKIIGQPGDPIADFRINVPANQKAAELDGWEFNIQHLFWDSGFGVSANYTIVDSDLEYDNALIGEQFALEGLGDSANLVVFYEKYDWSVRAAYNWRDEFLAGRFDGAGPNPVYTEPYGQLDLSVGYNWGENLSFTFEAINLTDEIQRLHSRTQNQVEFATQSGPRYMLGVRYKFGGPEPVAVAAIPPAPQVTCSDLDDDGDGVNNCDDKCPGSPAGLAVGSDGCPVPVPEPVPEPKPFRN
jgi:TonB-dependent receptor